MRYLYLLLRYGSFLLLFKVWACGGTCAFDETSRYARCLSFADTEKLFSRAEEISNLEVDCILAAAEDQNTTTFSIPFPNLSELSIHGCGNDTSEKIQMSSFHTIRSLNLSKNEITSLKWQKFQSSASDVLDLRQNPLSCDDCTNLWIWEHQNSITAKNSIWDLHYIVGLPRQILTDDFFHSCNFSHCPREEVHAYPLQYPQLKIGDTVRLECDVDGLKKPPFSENITNFKQQQFIWPLKNEILSENSTAFLNETWNSYLSKMSLEISSLSSHELGYVACICQHCLYRPAFDVLELRFETNLTVSLEEDERDSHLIVHGNPMQSLNITITRLSDNETESNILSSKKTTFFNDSLLLKFQQDHSHFFVRYYSLIVQECILCPPRLSSHIDGDYLIEVCRIEVGDCAIAKGFLDHPFYQSIKKIENDTENHRSRNLLLITIFLILLVIGLLIALSKTHLKHRLLKKGWELKRRRISRNTDRTEETSIRLDDYSASSSLNYIAQHVPLIDKEMIEIKEKIGKGAFGEVHCADWLEKDRTTIVAIKMLHGIPLDSDLDKEAALLAKMDHPNIVRLYGICRWDNQIALVMEMMNLGDLKSYVRHRQPRCDNYSQFPAPLLSTELLNIGAQIAAGLCYLNSQQIVHRDLAARNCLVQGESDLKCCNAAFRKPIAVKISDFGMSRRLYSDGEYYKMQNGKTVLPVRWLPPECLTSGKFTHQSDIWSFGMTLFELFSYGDVPFGDLSNNEVLTAVMSGMKPQLPSSFPEPVNNLISQCWRNAPEERITASEALNRLQIIQ